MKKLCINKRLSRVLNLSWLRAALLAPAIPYGGQAAIEGVMMKGTDDAALAVRRRDGSIEVLDRKVKSRFPGLVKLPFIRGFFILWDMMTLGMWALRESMHRYELDMEQAEREEKGEVPAGEPVKPVPESAPAQGISQYILMGLSLLIALFIFKIVPAMAATGVFKLIGWTSFKEIADPTIWQQLLANAIEGIVKLGIFIGYIWSVGRIKDIARVFQYHGAEHIVINAYEDNPQDQSIGFIEKHTTAHPRCGTSFLVILILLSIVLFTILDWAIVYHFPDLVQNNIPVGYVRWPLRILALPLLSGLSYEVIKAAFRYFKNPVLRPLLKFGMIFQALTTRRPDAQQIEVSLRSFNRARFLTEGIEEPVLNTSPES